MPSWLVFEFNPSLLLIYLPSTRQVALSLQANNARSLGAALNHGRRRTEGQTVCVTCVFQDVHTVSSMPTATAPSPASKRLEYVTALAAEGHALMQSADAPSSPPASAAIEFKAPLSSVEATAAADFAAASRSKSEFGIAVGTQVTKLQNGKYCKQS